MWKMYLFDDVIMHEEKAQILCYHNVEKEKKMWIYFFYGYSKLFIFIWNSLMINVSWENNINYHNLIMILDSE